jgi:putative ABC transport system ATP-binding protein
MLRLDAICRDYQVGDQMVHALDRIDLTIEAGEYISIMGPSGSGKSTLLNIIGLLDRPTSGHYLIENKDVAALEDDELAALRQQHVGFVFQSFHLISRLSALENVELPMLLAGTSTARRRTRAREVLADVGLETRIDHRPDQLSGGERQRVAIARAISMRPRLILADEPTGNLDSRAGKEIIRLIEQLNSAGMALIVVTHDPDVGRRARRRLSMHDGNIVGDDSSTAGHAEAGAETDRDLQSPVP